MMELERKIQKYKILALGRAWGGNQNKYMWDVCGKPSVQWAAEAVKKCKYIDRIAFITEDREIREAVENLGIFVIERPINTAYLFPKDFTKGYLKSDTPRSLRSKIPEIFTDAFEYAQYYLRETEGYCPDLLMHFSPEAPLITTETVNRVVEAFMQDDEAFEANTFYRIPPSVYFENATECKRMFPLLYNYRLDRQNYPKLYTVGPIHLYGRPSRTESGGVRVAPIFINEEEGLNLHTKEDLFKARCFMKRRLVRQEQEVGWKIEKEVANG